MLKVKNLCYECDLTSKKPKKIINNINLSLNQGDILGIIGKTGSGKSTLAQLLSGFLSPTEGEIILKGTNIKEYKKNLCFEIGLVLQYPENQLFCKTVFDDIAFGLKNKGIEKKNIEKCVIEAANFTNLDPKLLDRSPMELSGGEKRKCAISGIIAMNPNILILDEPTSALDPKSRVELLSALKKYHQQENKTILIISHVMEEIAFLCNKVLVIDNGEQKMFGNTQDIFNEYDELKKLGLDIPLTKKVIYHLNKNFEILNKDIMTPERAKKEIFDFISKNSNFEN